jgi:hypothetical protein
VRHPRQARHHHAEGHPACAEDTRRVGGRGVDLIFCRMVVCFWLVGGCGCSVRGSVEVGWAGLSGRIELVAETGGRVGGRGSFRFSVHNCCLDAALGGPGCVWVERVRGKG